MAGNIVMLEAEDGSAETLAERIQQLNVDPILVSSLDEIRQLLTDGRQLVSGLLLPTNLPGGLDPRTLKKELKALASLAEADLVLVAYGKTPDKDTRKRLRSAGLRLALWEPIEDTILRFQINRAVSGDTNDHNRKRARVATDLFARVYVGDREKDARVYSLSSGGAFLETPRATVDGARVDVELHLPDRSLVTPAEVVFSNVPGNLQRPNLPLGMGVSFDRLTREHSRAIDAYIKTCLDALQV